MYSYIVQIGTLGLLVGSAATLEAIHLMEVRI